MVASSKLPLIISLGIGFKYEWLDKLLNVATKYCNDITLLHCNNAYPTPIEDVNLLQIKKLLSDSRFKTGFSDHTLSPLTPSLAVAMGATTIEKHFTLSKHLPGPDHPFALEPNELKQMVKLIRETEILLSSKNSEFSKSEETFKYAMRSVVAKKDITVGEIFTIDNLTTKRPFLPSSIPAIQFENMIGQKSNKNYKKDDFI